MATGDTQAHTNGYHNQVPWETRLRVNMIKTKILVRETKQRNPHQISRQYMLAQLVRAQPRTQKVLGSNPTQGSSFFFEDDCLGICIVLLFHCLSGVSWSYITYSAHVFFVYIHEPSRLLIILSFSFSISFSVQNTVANQDTPGTEGSVLISEVS